VLTLHRARSLVDATGHIVVRRRLWRSGVIAYFRSLEPCLVAIEACATAHHWARELTALGHTGEADAAGRLCCKAFGVPRWKARARGGRAVSDFKGRHFGGEIVLWAVRW
jgi:hypothetical protein